MYTLAGGVEIIRTCPNQDATVSAGAQHLILVDPAQIADFAHVATVFQLQISFPYVAP